MGATSYVALVNYLPSLNLGFLICKMRTGVLEVRADRKLIFLVLNQGFSRSAVLTCQTRLKRCCGALPCIFQDVSQRTWCLPTSTLCHLERRQ